MRAAAPQSLYDHQLASVKHNLPAARPIALLVLVISTLGLCSLACATLPKHSSLDARSDPTPTRVENPLNINLASVNELEKLPGVGKVTAERIVAFRLENGPFRRVEHLMMVRGISENKFRAMQSFITAEPGSQDE